MAGKETMSLWTNREYQFPHIIYLFKHPCPFIEFIFYLTPHPLKKNKVYPLISGDYCKCILQSDTFLNYTHENTIKVVGATCLPGDTVKNTPCQMG